MNNYAIEKMSDELLEEIKTALKSVRNFGSVEIYIQKGYVTQITARKISKLASGDVSKLASTDVSKLTSGAHPRTAKGKTSS